MRLVRKALKANTMIFPFTTVQVCWTRSRTIGSCKCFKVVGGSWVKGTVLDGLEVSVRRVTILLVFYTLYYNPTRKKAVYKGFVHKLVL